MPLVPASRLDQLFDNQPRPRTSVAADTLLDRARVLPARDRLMLELAFDKHLSLRQIAQIMHLPAGTVSRRIARACARLRHPIVVALLAGACPFAGKQKQAAIEFFAQGKRIQDIAVDLEIPRTQVRAIIAFVRGWHRGAHPSVGTAKHSDVVLV